MSTDNSKYGLWLSPGGVLRYWKSTYDEATDTHTPSYRDVNGVAVSYLGEPVQMEEGITLRDLFHILQKDPALLAVFRRDFAKELLDEVLTKEAAGMTPKVDTDPESAIEYLEIYRVWQKNSSSSELSGVYHADFHGIGPVLETDIKDGDYVVHKAGSRINWGISFSSPFDLSALPLRYNPEVFVCEDDFNSKAWGSTLEKLKVPPITLFELLHAPLWEMSFHGAQDSREALQQDLADTVQGLKDGTVKTVPVDVSSL